MRYVDGMRFVAVWAIFFLGELALWPLCGAAIGLAIYYWAEEALVGLLWCWGQVLTVLAHRRQRAVVLAAPKRPQRSRVKLAGLREPIR